MEYSSIKMILVGYGYWGNNLLRNMIANPSIKVVGLVDPRKESRDKAKSLYPDLNTFSDMKDAIAQAKPDAAVIATPPATHCELAVHALQAGLHCLIEKPMATSSVECEEILSAAAANNKTVMVDHTFLFHAPVTHINENIHKGSYGDLLYYDSIRVNLGGIQMTNVLWDLAPHDLSILDQWTGGQLPIKASAIGVKHFDSPVETMCYINLIYPNNFNAHIHLNWAAPIKSRLITLGASEKMVVYDDNQPTEIVKVYDKGVDLKQVSDTDLKVNYRVGDMVAPAILKREALSDMLAEFVNSIQEQREPQSCGKSGHRVVTILEALSKSLNENGKVMNIGHSLKEIKSASASA